MHHLQHGDNFYCLELRYCKEEQPERVFQPDTSDFRDYGHGWYGAKI